MARTLDAPRRHRARDLMRQFLADDTRGSAAVEFVIVFPAFMFFFLFTFETGWFMAREMMFARAVDIASRDLRLGIDTNMTHDKFKDSICEHTIVFPNCSDDLVVELVTLDLNSAYPANEPNCRDRVDEDIEPKIEFSTGQRSDIMFIRACIPMDMMFPTVGFGGLKEKDDLGGIYITSYSAFMNEPE